MKKETAVGTGQRGFSLARSNFGLGLSVTAFYATRRLILEKQGVFSVSGEIVAR